MSSDVRLSATSYAVLGLIGYLQPCSVYDLKRYLEQSVENFWPVPHTTFYAEPARLARAGHLEVEQEPVGRRRKLYRLTDAGRQALNDWVQTPDAAPPQIRDELMLKVFLGADPGPMLAQRVQWHETKLAELEGYLAAVRAEGDQEGVERSLVVGTGWHRSILDLMAKLSGDG
jgi:DNA-binding PadR family transcriptional regulator